MSFASSRNSHVGGLPFPAPLINALVLSFSGPWGSSMVEEGAVELVLHIFGGLREWSEGWVARGFD